MKVKVSPDLIGGDVDEGYGKFADVFRRNMTGGQEIGAACAVYRDGKKVVDLWGGYRNGITLAPWGKDTLVNVFSTTKGVASLAIAVAVSQGLISYDAKVADFWSEFAQAARTRSPCVNCCHIKPDCPPLARRSRWMTWPTRRRCRRSSRRRYRLGRRAPGTVITASRWAGTKVN